MLFRSVAFLHAEIGAILRDPETRAGLLKQGLAPKFSSPEDLGRLVEADLERWGRVVRDAKISAD